MKTDFSWVTGWSFIQKLEEQNLIRNQVPATESLVCNKRWNEDWFIKTRGYALLKQVAKFLVNFSESPPSPRVLNSLCVCAWGGCFSYPFFSFHLPLTLTTGFWSFQILKQTPTADYLGSNLSSISDLPCDLGYVLNPPMPQPSPL